MKKTPLRISCTNSDCDAGLHCFRPRRGMAPEEHGSCRDCGVDVVDWEVAHARDLSRAGAVFDELPKELVRHHYWHMDLPEPIRAKAERGTPAALAARARRAIDSRVSAPSRAIFRDGTQTPNERSRDAQVYFLGMHAVAACCRKCMEYWHGIPRERPLTEDEQRYFAALVWMYVCHKLDWPDEVGLLSP